MENVTRTLIIIVSNNLRKCFLFYIIIAVKEMESKKFTMIDEPFICEVCGEEVKPLGYTARNHCPFCLSSKHVDVNPGDRLEECHGVLKPIAIEKFKDTFKIIYKCEKCGKIRKNVMAKDDNFEKILEIMANPINID